MNLKELKLYIEVQIIRLNKLKSDIESEISQREDVKLENIL